MQPSELPCFFDDGLRFECTRCSRCCTGAPGTIYVSDEERHRISDFLDLEPQTLIREYLYRYRDAYSILEQPNGDCRFLKDRACAIEPVKPSQCRAYPFWYAHLRSRESWRRAGQECPGIDRGRLFSAADILRMATGGPPLR